jgi:heptosyltransferase-2/heptosyltransferase-3
MVQPRLLVFFARVGDLVMLTPLARHLATLGGVELLARPWAERLLKGQPWLGAVHGLERPNAPAWQDLLTGGGRRRLGRVLAARNYREILVFHNENRTVKHWINSWRGSTPMRELPLDGNDGGSRHMVDVYRRAAAKAGLDGEGFPMAPELAVDAAQLAQTRQMLARLGSRVVAVQAGSSLTHRWLRKQPNLKGLTPQQWGGWLTRLLASGAIDAAVLLGSRQERREAQAIIAATPRRQQVHDWTGRVGLGELPALFAACCATLSVDTGPGHIAAAVGCPLISIFGPTDPAVFLPRGPGRIELLLGQAPCQFCHWTPRFKTCRDNVCLSRLPDAALDEAWARLMRANP